jgi:hypothetical protein
MSPENKEVTGNVSKQESVILEMQVDESEKNKYKLILPMSYGVEFSEVDGKGKSISASSLSLNGMQTVIRTPGLPSKWKLIVKNRADRSNTDPTGVPVSVDSDGSGDGYGDSDWLMIKKDGLDKKSLKTFQGAFHAARRTIVFQQDEAIVETDLKKE